MAANSALRCAIDLSDGTSITPSADFAGRTVARRVFESYIYKKLTDHYEAFELLKTAVVNPMPNRPESSQSREAENQQWPGEAEIVCRGMAEMRTENRSAQFPAIALR